MSDGIKRWHEDQDYYLELCKRFREEPQYVMSAYGNLHPDCYGQHATELQMRAMREEKRRKKKKRTRTPSRPGRDGRHA